MQKCINIVLLVCLSLGAYQWRQETVRMDYVLAQVEKEKADIRLDLDKVRDESYLMRMVVLANLAKIADPIPNKLLTVTAYSAVELTQSEDQQLLTASLSKPKEGAVAVSRDLFKQGWVFGKKVYIKNHGVFIITDLMGGSKNKSVDIFMNDHGRALQFGKQQIEVVLLDV